MIFWTIRKACIKYDTVVNIARTHFSRQKFIHILRSFVDPISVDVTHNCESLQENPELPTKFTNGNKSVTISQRNADQF